jgi:hypothetical protein
MMMNCDYEVYDALIHGPQNYDEYGDRNIKDSWLEEKVRDCVIKDQQRMFTLFMDGELDDTEYYHDLLVILDMEKEEDKVVEKRAMLATARRWTVLRCRYMAKALQHPNSEGETRETLLKWLANWFGITVEELNVTPVWKLIKEHRGRFSEAQVDSFLTMYRPELWIARQIYFAIRLE